MAREETDPSDNMKELCVECAGTWKVACYGAWCPHSEFWDDFLEDGWEEGAYTPRSCCLRLLCGMLFLTLAPVWCCKALFYCLFLPCIFLWRAVKSGELFNSRHQKKLEKQKSEPLAYIEPAQPNHPSELYTISNTTQSLGQHIPEIRIEAEQENGTFSPDQALSPNGTNAQSHHDVGPYSESDLMLTENGSSRQWQNAVLDSQATSANGVLVTPEQYHGYTNAVLEPTDHSMCEAIVLEGFQGITGKVTSV